MKTEFSKVLFSIIVPSFNQAAYLRTTLASVLSQEGVDLEVLIFDAQSTDGSAEIIKAFAGDSRVTASIAPDFGQAHAINKGLRIARGEYVAYLNSDDIYYPRALARVHEAFTQDPTALFLYGNALHIAADGSVIENYPVEPWSYQRLLEVCFLCQPAVFWRRSALQQVGFFDDTLQMAMDYEYWLRAGSCTAFRHLSGPPLAGSRLHADTKTLSQRVAVHRECLEVVLRYTTAPKPVLIWLKHLAHHQAVAAYMDVPDHSAGRRHDLRFAQNILDLSLEYGVLLDLPTLRLIDEIIHNCS